MEEHESKLLCLVPGSNLGYANREHHFPLVRTGSRGHPWSQRKLENKDKAGCPRAPGDQKNI